MKQTTLVLIIFSLLVAFLPLPVYGIILVPCGRADQQPPQGQPLDPVKYPDAQCQLKHLIFMISRLINYLISLAALVAMYQVLLAAFWLTASLGNPEKIKTYQTALSNAVVGFGIVAIAFVMVNLLLNGILGRPGETRKWWEAECIYGIGSSKDCPLGIGTSFERQQKK